MKTILLSALLLFSLNSHAQVADTTGRDREVALHLKKAGKCYNTSLALMALGGVIAGTVIAMSEEGDDTTPAIATAGAFGVVALGFRLGGNGHLIKAGKAMED